MTVDAKPRAVCLPVANWPVGDQERWEHALARSNGPFRGPGGKELGPYNIRNLQSSYGRFLTYLTTVDGLDASMTPLARVNRAILDGYLADLRAHGNRGQTIKNRIVDLENILARMHPDEDVRWISRPTGKPIDRFLDLTPKSQPVPDAAVLMDHAQRLFLKGLRHGKPRCRRALVRDAAILCLLVARAPRLRALTGLRLGVHLIRLSSGWKLLRTAELEKTGIEHETDLAPELTEILDRYVTIERAELLDGARSDAVWVAQGGGELAADTISRRTRIHTGWEFGESFGPHAYRKAAATFLAHHCPEDPLAGPTILGHASPTTTLAHYNRARATVAGQRYADLLAKIRK